jgi:hypothetical protein
LRSLPVTKEQEPPHGTPCPMAVGCQMYDLFSLSGMLGLWQSLYCEADFRRCERFRLAQQGIPVPKGLLPDGKELRINKPARLKP